MAVRLGDAAGADLAGRAEMREHRRPMKDEDKPKVLQRLINGVWKDSKRPTAREEK